MRAGYVRPENPRTYTRRPPLERFQRSLQIDSSTECWSWQRSIDKDGYGKFWDGTSTVPAHRWSYRYYRGSIPAELEIDHRCRNRACVNPIHLQLVTHARNNQLKSNVLGGQR